MADDSIRTGSASDLLTGPDAGEVLAAAVAAAGAELRTWRCTELDVQRGVATAAYRAVVLSHGTETVEVLCATTGGPIPDGVTVVGDGDERIGVWRAAHDPSLPGLRSALDPRAAAALADRCGLGNGPVSVRLRAYRPLRRAVVEVRRGNRQLFLKVVRPEQAEALHDRHRLLTTSGVPAPRSLGWSDDGLVVLEALTGSPLRTVLRSGVPTVAVDPAAFTAVLDRLPGELLETPRRSSWLERTEHYARSVGTAVPDLAERSTGLAREIVAQSIAGPTVPVHGDFYEGQLLVDDRGTVSGLLDVDTAGPGDRLDDLGCLVGHLSVLAQVLPAYAGPIHDLATRSLTVFDQQVDPAQLRLRVASVVLSLATGPHRVQDAGWQQTTRERVALAEGWFDSAHRAHRSPRLHLQEGNHHVRLA